MNQPHIIKEGESNDSSSIYKCNLSTDVWKPLNHQIHINNLTENNYEMHQLQSNPNIKTPHSPKLDLANSAAAQESDDKDDILCHFSIRDLDPEWRDDKVENKTTRPINDSIDQTNPFQERELKSSNLGRPGNLSLTESISQIQSNPSNTYFGGSMEKINNGRDDKTSKMISLRQGMEHIVGNDLGKQYQPKVNNQMDHPISSPLGWNVNGSRDAAWHTSLPQSDQNISRINMNYQHFPVIPNEVINSSSSNNTMNTKPSEVGSCMNDMNSYGSYNMPKAISGLNGNPDNALNGNIQGTSSHIHNFTNNVYNIPPPPFHNQ